MKKIILTLTLFATLVNFIVAQSCYEIANIEIIPEYPCQGEQVFMVVQNSFCAICDCEADGLSLNPYAFPTTYNHLFVGAECDFACTSLDTIALGTMPFGNMIFNYSLIVDTSTYFTQTQQIEVINCNQINYPTTIIDTAYFLNQNLCENDSLQIVVELFTAAACGCNANSFDINLASTTPQLNTYYAFGLCQATCSSIDTFNIGTWQNGNHTLQINSISNEVGPPYQFLTSYNINFGVDDCLNNFDVFVDANITLYPNPTAQFFTIEGLIGNYNIQILDVAGNVYQTITTSASTYTIDLNLLPTGIFLIAIEKNGNGNVRLEKILKY